MFKEVVFYKHNFFYYIICRDNKTSLWDFLCDYYLILITLRVNWALF